VHASLGEVVEPTRMIEVQVGEQDVSHVLGAEAESLDLTDGGLSLLERRTVQPSKEWTESPLGLTCVARAEAGIDEHEAVLVGLDEQAVANELRRAQEQVRVAVHQHPAERTHGHAVEVVNAHRRPPVRRRRAMRMPPILSSFESLKMCRPELAAARPGAARGQQRGGVLEHR
jgi:hypothetical protein